LRMASVIMSFTIKEVIVIRFFNLTTTHPSVFC
jgi:hypothetical protein